MCRFYWPEWDIYAAGRRPRLLLLPKLMFANFSISSIGCTYVKLLLIDFTVHGTFSRSAITVILSVSFFQIPVAYTFNFLVKRRDQMALLRFLMDHFGPRRCTIKSTVAATGLEK